MPKKAKNKKEKKRKEKKNKAHKGTDEEDSDEESNVMDQEEGIFFAFHPPPPHPFL